jgi:hypothetical protein
MKSLLNKNIYILPIIISLFVFVGTKISSVIAACEGGVGEGGKLVYCPLESGAFDGFTSNASEADKLGTFLGQAFQFGLALAAALAVIMIVWGGVKMMTTDSYSSKSEGKEIISNAIWGLLLALASWLILYIINPDILNFKL